MDTKVIRVQSITLNENDIARRLGYEHRTPPASVSSLIDVQIKNALGLIKPAYGYKLVSINSVSGDETLLADGVRFSSKIVSYALSGCRLALVYIATIGSDLENEAQQLMSKGKILDATVLDMVGIEAVSQVLNGVRCLVREMARESNLRATIQYAPGYCDWDVSQQKVLFQIIGAGPIGVRLTESYMMVPQKSVSGIIGIGKLDLSKPPPCLAVCTRSALCTHKRRGWNPEKESVM